MAEAYHDKFVRSGMGFKDVSIPFLHYSLSPKLLDAVDVEKVELSQESYIAASLKERISDLVFRIPYVDYEALFYILIEHKSSGADRNNEPKLPWQLALLERDLMEALRRMHEKKRLPLVHCLGLYHGKNPYRGPTAVAELMDAPPDLIPDRWRQEFPIIDLGGKSDAEIIALGGKLSVFLLVLKHIYDDNPIVALRQLKERLREVEASEDGIAFVSTVITYLMKAMRKERHEEVKTFMVESLSEEGGAAVISIADALREEGAQKERAKAEKMLAEANARIEEERIKGRLEGIRDIILSMKSDGTSFKTCVETLKLSDEVVQGLITNFPELVST